MNNGSHISDGGQTEIRFNPTGNVGAVERGGIKTAPGGSPFFDLNDLRGTNGTRPAS